MSPETPWEVVLFQSVSQAIRAEKILMAAGVACKLIPVPRHLSSDCGVCLRFESSLHRRVEEALGEDKAIGVILPLATPDS